MERSTGVNNPHHGQPELMKLTFILECILVFLFEYEMLTLLLAPILNTQVSFYPSLSISPPHSQ